MCFTEKWGPIFLKVINVIFLIFGLALIVPGVLILANNDVVNSKVLPLMKQLTFGGINIGDMIIGLCVSLIVVGTLVILVSLLGLIGACSGNPAYLDIYGGIVLILFLIKAFAVFMWIENNSKLETWMKTNLVSLLNNYGSDDLTTSETSTSWNYLFMLMSCCGVNAVTGINNDFDTSAWITSSSAGSKHIPTSCCTGVTSETYSTFTNTACTDSVTSGYNTKGCYDAIYTSLSAYYIIFIAVGVTVMVVEALAVVAAVSKKHNDRYSETSTSEVEDIFKKKEKV
ncbi:tetraspanin-18-like [Crassostrea angulata]|uniref:tetraspanin-18-like n=1 Tax=Magallana angulata TaxID=2784310 RepID=UPI0022B1720A|nr:tetraspanin-18-like [Crassostrea angulata]XP_052674200.1 tetraspanin-18-like [Crassostrea angulata]